MTSNVYLFTIISICHSNWVFFQPLEIRFPVKVVMFYVSISSSIDVHQIKANKIALLDGSKQIEGWMDRILFCLIEKEQLLCKKLELNIICYHLIFHEKRFPLGSFFRLATPKSVHNVFRRRDFVEAMRMSVIPEGMQKLKPDTLFGILRNEDFLQAMSDIDFAHSLETFVPGVREVAEQCVVFVVVAFQKFLDECLVVSDDCTGKQCLFGIGLAQNDHVAEPALAALLLDLFAFLSAADHMQGVVTDEVGDFHDGQQVENVPDLVVYVEEGLFGPQPFDGLSFPFPLLHLFN